MGVSNRKKESCQQWRFDPRPSQAFTEALNYQCPRRHLEQRVSRRYSLTIAS